MNNELIFSFQEFLKIFPGIIIFPFTVYFIWLKLRSRVSAYITISQQATSADRVSSIVLINHRDRIEPIFVLQGVIDGKKTFTLKEFNPPLLLKAFESLSIEMDEYSSLDFSNGSWRPTLNEMKKFQLFIVGNKPKLKVNIVSSPSQKARDAFIKLEQGKKSLFKINGMVYNENVKYAITYSLNEKETTALVQKTGFIDKNWNFAIHHIPLDALESAKSLRMFLVQNGFENISKEFRIETIVI